MRFLLPAVFVSTVGLAFGACSFPVKVPAECFPSGTSAYCGSDAECGADARCDTALSTPACVSVNCLPEDALCSSDDMCLSGAHCYQSHCNSACSNCGTPDAAGVDTKNEGATCIADGLPCNSIVKCCTYCVGNKTCGCVQSGGDCNSDTDCCSLSCDTGGSFSCF